MTDVSIVIVTHGHWEITKRCLASLEHALGRRLGVAWEVIVVDNASADETRQQLQEQTNRIRVKLLDINRNFGGGCNLGAELAHGDMLVFLNNDTEVPAGALERLCAQAREPGVVAAGCRLLFPDGTLQHAGIAFVANTALGGAAMPQHVFHHHDGSLGASRAVFEADAVTAACMAVRADAFAAVGGFDERYENGLEDIDLCLKLRLAGHRIVYRGDIDLIHHEGASRGTGAMLWSTPTRLAAMARNDRLFISRWGTQLDQDDALAEHIWDASLRQEPPAKMLDESANVALIGSPSGVGPAADESRALLFAMETTGLTPAAYDVPPTRMIARVDRETASLLDSTLARAAPLEAKRLIVVSGPHDRSLQLCTQAGIAANACLRLATQPTWPIPPDLGTILVPCRATADLLVKNGLAAPQIQVLPPLARMRALGSGGAGVLAVIAFHDQHLASTILAALRTLPRTAPVSIVPTAYQRDIVRDMSAILPGAQLLSPCSCESRFAQLAAAADLVIIADRSDYAERRAIVAAQVGTPVLTSFPDGPAAEVLGTDCVAEPQALAGTIRDRLIDPPARLAVAEVTRVQCDPHRISEFISADHPA